jgi:hypothetical protein
VRFDGRERREGGVGCNVELLKFLLLSFFFFILNTLKIRFIGNNGSHASLYP